MAAFRNAVDRVDVNAKPATRLEITRDERGFRIESDTNGTQWCGADLADLLRRVATELKA